MSNAPAPSLTAEQIADVELAYKTLLEKQDVQDTFWSYYDGDSKIPYVTRRLREVFDHLDIDVRENWSAVVVDAVADRIDLQGFRITGLEEAKAEQMRQEREAAEQAEKAARQEPSGATLAPAPDLDDLEGKSETAPPADTTPPIPPRPLGFAEEQAPMTAQEALDAYLKRSELLLEADDAHRAMLVAGESYVIAWKELDEDTGEEELEVYFNDARMCHVFYHADKPRKIRFAAKWWVDELEKRHLLLYYPDVVEHYVSRRKAADIKEAKQVKTAFVLESSEPNPFERVPVYHYRPDRQKVKSDLKDVTPLQDGLAMLMTNLMVGAEFDALPQKYIISQLEVRGQLKSGPGLVWEIPATEGQGQPTTVGQFQAADLQKFVAAMDRLTSSIATITRTPKHYFDRSGGDPSGEALIALEAPLIKKVQDRIARVAPVWRRLAAFLLELLGYDIAEEDIEPVFRDPATVQPMTRATITQTRVATGIPLKTVLRKEEGWSESEVESMEADGAADKKAQAASLASAMLQAQAGFDRGENAGAQTMGAQSQAAPASRPAQEQVATNERPNGEQQQTSRG